MKRDFNTSLPAIAVMALASAALAQPANDLCENAIPIVNHSVTPWDTTGAGSERTLGCSTNTTRKDVWFSYVATGQELVTITTCGSGTRAKIISAFWGGCGGPELDCTTSNSSVCPGQSNQVRSVFGTPDAGIVFICVTTTGTSNVPTGVLNLDAVPFTPPVNDVCQNAIPIANHSVTNWDTTGAGIEGPTPCLSNTNRKDIWYSYTCTGPEQVIINTCGSNNRLKALTAYWGACGGQSLGCVIEDPQNSCQNPAQVELNFATPGAGTVYFCLATRGSDANLPVGVLTLNATPVVVVENDTCATALLLPGPGSYPFDSRPAATDGPSAACSFNSVPDGRDLYFKYTASTEGYITIDTLQSVSGDTTLQVLDACGGAVLACNDFAFIGTGLSKICSLPVTNGATYYIRVATRGVATTGMEGVLTVSHAGPPPQFTVPEGALLEPGGICDSHDDDVNRGCWYAETRTSPLTFGSSYQGHAMWRTTANSHGEIVSDFDAYSFTLTEPVAITVTGQTQFQAEVFVISGCGESPLVYHTISSLPSCGVGNFTYTVERVLTGTWILGINNDNDPSATCSNSSEYWFTVTATPVCLADIGIQGGTYGMDGLLDNNDFVYFIDAFFLGAPIADFGRQGGLPGRDGEYDNNDFIVFIDQFFQGCPQ